MSPVDSVTVIVRGSPARERQWYAALARLVAAAPLPAAVLVESASDRPHAQLTVRPPDLVDVLRRSLAGASVRLTDIPGHAPTPSPRLRAERTAYLVGTGRNRSIPLERERVVVDRIGIGGGTPPGSWLGLQTFWLPGGRGFLRVARRFRFAIDAKEAANRAFPAAGAAVAA